jgi:NitT/TauT family transport system substrate-binding protein
MPPLVTLPSAMTCSTPLTRTLLSALLSFSLVGCSFGESVQKAEEAGHFYDGQVMIGISDWVGYIALYVANDQGYFADEGVHVRFRDYGSSIGSLSQAYRSGELHGRGNLVIEALTEAYGGLDHKVILAVDYSNGADAIVAKSDIRTAADMVGKRVGFEPGTLEEYFVRWVVREAGQSMNDILPVHGNSEESLLRLQEGTIDAGALYQPFLSQALASEDLHVLYSSQDAPGLITDVLTFRTDFIEQYPGTLKAIVRAYFRALQFIRDHPDEAYAIVAQKFDTTAEDIEKQLQGVTLLDERANRTAFTFAAGLQSLYGNLRQVNDFVYSQLEEEAVKIDSDTLVEKKFARGLGQ